MDRDAPEARSGLDPWTRADLPAPPVPKGLSWIGVVGPGVIVLGLSIGVWLSQRPGSRADRVVSYIAAITNVMCSSLTTRTSPASSARAWDHSDTTCSHVWAEPSPMMRPEGPST